MGESFYGTCWANMQRKRIMFIEQMFSKHNFEITFYYLLKITQERANIKSKLLPVDPGFGICVKLSSLKMFAQKLSFRNRKQKSSSLSR